MLGNQDYWREQYTRTMHQEAPPELTAEEIATVLQAMFAERTGEDEPYYPGVDLDGKPRLDPFALHFVAEDSRMDPSIERPPRDPDAPPPGSVQRSPFV